MTSHVLIWILLTCCVFTLDANAQSVERKRPDEWIKLAYGGRFMDRFLAMPVQGRLTSETWGADNVKPRYIDNGLEDNDWSYWGGNAKLGADGKYHLYVCRWREDSPRGHMEWSRSIVVHAVADLSTGPYKVKDTVGRLLTILDKERITAETKTIRVKIAAEDDFNPHTDIDLDSLRFGACEEVNFGRGCKVIKTERSGDDLIVTFDGTGNGITDDNFAAKLLGRNSNGKLLYGYARLPWLNYLEPALSACTPKIDKKEDGFNIAVEVQNFGQVSSEPADIKIVYSTDDQVVEVAAGTVRSLKPFQKTTIELTCGKIFEAAVAYALKVIINPNARHPVTLERQITPVPKLIKKG